MHTSRTITLPDTGASIALAGGSLPGGQWTTCCNILPSTERIPRDRLGAHAPPVASPPSAASLHRAPQARTDVACETADRSLGPLRISVIIPTLNEAADIEATLRAVQPLRAAGHEVIVVDGGSADATAALATPLADVVTTAPRGRAAQMNAGAALAAGDICLFLHADTTLPAAAATAIIAALEPGRHEWGHFDVTIAGRSRWLPVVAAMMNLRSRATRIATGDQALFVTRRAFAAVGGFPDWPLMEDIALSRALRCRSAPAALRLRVATAGRRWDANGPLRTILLMWWLRLRFFLGARPDRLATRYSSPR